MGLFCKICNVGVSSEITMRDHVKGRRHTQAVATETRRRTLAKCSLYCRDFSMTTTEAMLHQYFSQFGAISRVMLVAEKLTNGTVMRLSEQLSLCGPAYMQKHFPRLLACQLITGTVKAERMILFDPGRYCIVHYEHESAVQRALEHPDHQLQGSRLTVRPRRPITMNPGHSQQSEVSSNQQKSKAAVSEKAEAQKKADHEHLMQTLLQAQSVVEQMDLLHSSLQLSEVDLKIRRDLCQYLHSCLLPFFPTCTIHAFGSSVNGYGMKGCDIDVFLDFHDDEVSRREEQELKKTVQRISLPYVEDIDSIPTKSGPLLPSHLRNMPLVERVRLLSRLLVYRGQSCANICTIPSARCPITRFVHIETGLKCDMSINNRLALKNTELLRLCSQDKRVQLLMFVVRYWANWKQMAGNAGSGPRLSNYCLTLLVMFYLANTDPPVLPTVEELSEMAEEECFIEGWNCSVPSSLPPSRNTQSAEELLHGFFEFFSHMDFSSSVILTRTATTMTLHQFLVKREYNPALEDFKIKAMAVQDPFVLNHNIAFSVNGRTRDLLTTEMRIAASKTAGWSAADPQSCVGSSSFAGWGLPCLFSSLGCQAYSHFAVSTPLSGTTQSKDLTCSLVFDLSMASPQILWSLHATGDYKSAWYKCVHRLLLQTLRDVFLFRLLKENGDPIEEDLDSSQEEPIKQAGGLQTCSDHISKDDVSGVRQDEQELERVCCSEKLWQESEAFSNPKSLQAASVQEVKCLCLWSSFWSPESDCPAAASSASPWSPHSTPMKSCRSSKHRVKRQTSDSGSAFAGKKRVRSEQQHRFGRCRGTKVNLSSAFSGHGTHEESVGRGGFSSVHASATDTKGQQQMSGSSENMHWPSHQPSGSPKAPEKDVMVVAGENKQILPQETGCEGKPPSPELPTESTQQSTSMDWDQNSGCQNTPSTSGTSKTLPDTTSQGLLCCSGRVIHHQGTGNTLAEKQTAEHTCPKFLCLCEGHCRTWYGRKALRSVALANGLNDDFELERYVSHQIYIRDSGSSMEPIKLKCALSMVQNPDKTEAEVSFEPCTSAKEISVFVAYFKSFFPRVVSRHFMSVSTT